MTNPWLNEDHGRDWDAGPKARNPFRAEQIEMVVRLAGTVDPKRILDLGCGTGEIGKRLLDHLPGASYVGLDASASMLERARLLLDGYGERAHLEEGLIDRAWPDRLGTFDVIVSVQVVHHLESAEKRLLFARCLGALGPGGLLLLSDKVALDDERLLPQYRTLWNHAREGADFPPLPDSHDLDAYHADLASDGDLPDRVRDQVTWLEEAGFDPAGAFWIHADRAIFGGFRPLL